MKLISCLLLPLLAALLGCAGRRVYMQADRRPN
jgi:hypothetical protein